MGNLPSDKHSISENLSVESVAYGCSPEELSAWQAKIQRIVEDHSAFLAARDGVLAQEKAERATQVAVDPDLQHRIDQAESWIKRLSARKGIPVHEGFLFCLLGLADPDDFSKMVQDRLGLSDQDLQAAKCKVFTYCEEAYELLGDETYLYEEIHREGGIT